MKDILQRYIDRCGSFSIEYDDTKPYIYTERFFAEPLNKTENSDENYLLKVNSLFDYTFGNEEVMSKFAFGVPKTISDFEGLVQTQSSRWAKNYPFAGFLITDKSNDVVVGYECIGNGSKDNTGELVYLFNAAYHRSETVKNVGYENVGALVLGYGKDLSNKAFVNSIFNNSTNSFVEGSIFSKIEATVRLDNIGSKKILENLGFQELGIVSKFNAERYDMNLDYNSFANESVLTGENVCVLNE